MEGFILVEICFLLSPKKDEWKPKYLWYPNLNEIMEGYDLCIVFIPMPLSLNDYLLHAIGGILHVAILVFAQWQCQWIWILVFNATFSNISATSWRPVLEVEQAGVHGENHWPNLVEIRIPMKFSVCRMKTNRKFLRNPNLNKITTDPGQATFITCRCESSAPFL